MTVAITLHHSRAETFPGRDGDTFTAVSFGVERYFDFATSAIGGADLSRAIAAFLDVNGDIDILTALEGR
ncbi:hypothetical protein CKA32_001107 [Geitlerinema sp. FC II]|nr:hypothetical protein CKA32_001107 [Geitlerinema sp. FC II]